MEIPAPESPIEALDDYQPWVRQARFFAWLIYPKPEESEARTIATFKISMWRSPADADQHRWAYSDTLGGVFPIDRRVLNGGRKRMEERMRKRIEAGYIALRRLQNVERALASGTDVPRWNLSSEFGRACRSLGLEEIKNFQHRYWEPSLPVLPLCATVVARIKDAELEGRSLEEGFWDVLTPSLLPDFLAQAAGFQHDLLQHGLRFPAEQIVRLTLDPILGSVT